jgi:hypothetical protein
MMMTEKHVFFAEWQTVPTEVVSEWEHKGTPESKSWDRTLNRPMLFPSASTHHSDFI